MPSVVVSVNYDTSGNNGRRIVKLSNGWIIVLTYNSSDNTYYIYRSQDNGTTWSQLCTIFASNPVGASIANIGTNCTVLFRETTQVYSVTFDVTTVTNVDQSPNKKTIMTVNALSQFVSITSDGTGALHSVFSAQTPTYPNSYNVFYSKSTDGGITWATPTQITTLNTSGWYAQNPCIVVNSSNVPTIVWETQQGTNVNSIMSAAWNGTTWNATTVYAGGSTQQSKSCVIVDSNNNIHVFWLSSTTTIYHSVSTNGGSTWSAPDTAYTGTSLGSPSVGYDSSSNNKIYIAFSAGATATVYYISGNTNAWSAPTTVGAGTNPQVLWSEFNENSSDAIRYIWDTGSAVNYDSITINFAPNAPTLTAHSNFDSTVAQSLTWAFSDPNTGDTQSAYQLQIVDTGNSQVVVDTGKVASTTSSYTLAANALTNGHNYQWRVTTWDQSNAQGPYSAYSTFSCAATPTVTITTPSNNASVAQSSLTAQFSYSDPASLTQQSYQVQILDSADSTVLSDSGTINGTNNQYTIPYTLANNTTYHVKVRATNSQSITSAWADNTFSTSFTLPATPTISLTQNTGYIGLAITNPTPTGGQPTIAYNDVYRRNTGTTSWTRIATNIANNGTYNDYAVASGQSYDYKVTAVGNNQTSADSSVSSKTITFNGLYIHDINNAPGTLLNLLYQTQAKTSTWTAAATPMKFAGRKRPVVEFGETDEYMLESPNVTVMTSDNQWNALESLIQSKPLLCVRDGRGRVKFSTVLTYKATDVEYGYEVDLQFTEVDHSEAV